MLDPGMFADLWSNALGTPVQCRQHTRYPDGKATEKSSSSCRIAERQDMSSQEQDAGGYRYLLARDAIFSARTPTTQSTTNMNAARHARIKEVFLAVQSLAPHDRNAKLDQACAEDPDLRKEVESLLGYRPHESILAKHPPLPASAPRRIAEINFGHAATAQWDEEQRHLLHKRIQLWALVLSLIVLMTLLRAFGIFGGVSRLVGGWIIVGIVTASLSIAGLSARVVFLRAPSTALLRRLEVAMNVAGAFVIFAWNHTWLTRGTTLHASPFEQLDKVFESVYWAVSSDRHVRHVYFQMPPAMIGLSLATLSATLGCLYALIVPNTRRRGISMVVAAMVVPSITLVTAALNNPSLYPYLIKNLLFCWLITGAFSAITLYVSLQSASLRRAVFEARQVGRYQLLRQLGHGAMGDVYLAQHHLLRRPCALKLIRSEQATSQDWLMRFEREVQAMAQLTHPNTVEVYDFGRTDDNSFFYAMEYLPGMTLDTLVRKYGPLPPGRVVYLMLQICGALAEAHRKGLIHRDVKPGNIFVSERGGEQDFIKLLDFGLVHGQTEDLIASPVGPSGHRNTRLTQTGQLMGTPMFMSPEQIRGEKLDERSDIYSLGSVAYFLLTGRAPFDCETLAEIFEAHLSAPIPRLRDFNPELPADVEAVITRCLGKTRETRFQTVVEVAEALGKTAAAGEWTSAQAEAWWQEHPVSQETEKALDAPS